MELIRHFRSGPLTIVEEETEHQLEISEWLTPGAMVCSLDVENGAGTMTLQAEEGTTELSEDGTTVIAVVAGYPYLDIQDGETKNIVTARLEPMLEISDGGWSAKLTLYPPLPETTMPEPTRIIKLLQESGIRFGIREKTIHKAHESIRRDNGIVHNMVIARGRLPVNGQDGKLRFAIELGAQPGKERLDGSIDFKERNLFVGVTKGQLLATRTPPTTGVTGMNIFGEEIPPKQGRELILSPGPDLLYDESTGEIRAGCDGVAVVVNSQEVKVTDLQVIPKDVDYSTGNIRSKGSLEIKGDLLQGFSITAAGDVVVDGKVAGGTIECGANVIIKGGVTGKGSAIKAKGDVELSFIEEGSVRCRGSVRIARAVYYSDIRSSGDIVCSPETKIIGSTLIAGGRVKLGHVDTESSPNSLVAAACSPERYEEFLRLQKNIAANEKKLTRMQALVGAEGYSAELTEQARRFEEDLLLLRNYNMVPEGASNSKTAGIRYASQHGVTVYGSILTGAAIRIGNHQTRLHKSLSTAGTIELDTDRQRIMFRPVDQKQQPSPLP